jgi:anti-sigma factor RsiW
VSCSQTRQYLDAWLDGELDSATAQSLETHVRTCPTCNALKAERHALIARVRDAAPRFTAPPQLRRAVEATPWSTLQRRPTRVPRWWHGVALAVASSVLSVVLTVLVVRWPGETGEPSTDELVSLHTRSLAGSLVDLGSRDRHQVKPWFQGKVDFAPIVRDLSALGFELEGARLERLDGHTAVAVVYRIRNHPINLFVWRSQGEVPTPIHLSRARGFALARWHDQGLGFAAISDADSRDLERFAQALAAVP